MKGSSNMLKRYYNEQLIQGSRSIPFTRLLVKDKAVLKASVGFKVWQIGETLRLAAALVVCIATSKAIENTYQHRDFTKGGICCPVADDKVGSFPISPPEMVIVKADLKRIEGILRKKLKKGDSIVLRA